MRELYKKIKELNPNADNILITGLEGNLFGEKILLTDGNIEYATPNSDALYACLMKNIKDNSKDIYSKENSNRNSVYFAEKLGAEKSMVICGGGHVSMPIIRIAKMIGFQVTVLEDRPSFADHARRAGADEVICEDFAGGLCRIEGDKDTFFVIVTRGHRYDMVCLEQIVPKEHAYIGMIGSKLRVKNVLEAVEEKLSVHEKYRGSKEDLKKEMAEIYSPIGLKIHAQTPEEIAVAIIAEIIQVKNTNSSLSTFPKELLTEILSEERSNMGKVLATIVKQKGSTPRGIGTKMVFFQDGTCVGTIGGGCAEADVQRKSILLMNQTKPLLYKVDMTGREAEEDGMVCGGLIEVLLEPFI